MSEPGGARPGSADPPKLWTSLALIQWTQEYFAKAGIASPRLDAEVLLAHALGCRRLDLYLDFERPVDEDERATYRQLVARRARERVPVALLTGKREFWSRSFEVTSDVLVPRPETELLVERAARAKPDTLLDFGTGSGNVACALALELPGLRAIALDRSRAALAVARRNVESHELASRVALVCASSLRALSFRFDMVVSNPPYIPSADLAGLEPELSHEPRLALDGGSDGLDCVRQLLAEAKGVLRPGGTLMIEIGAGQASAVVELARPLGAACEVARDLAGIERVVEVRFGGETQ